MSQYDDETGLVLSDEEEIVKEAALEEKKKAEENSPESDSDSTAPVQVVPRINKKFILLVVASLASVIMIASLVRPDKDKKKVQDDALASELSVPDFSNTRRVYEEPVEPPPAPSVELRPVYAPPPQTAQRPQSQGQGTARLPDESEVKANSATLIPTVQGRLLGQEVQGGYIASAPQGQNPYLQTISSLGIPIGQDEYTASRISALGGLGGGGAAGGSQPNGGMNYQQQNMQDNKQSFYSTGREETATGEFIGTDTLWNGSMIPGVLITGINTDLPGDIQARVTENIYDSLTGNKLLIPQGSILIASYNSSVSFAQSRVQIAWNTLIRPDGFQISLGNMNGVDAQGYSGTKGKVDEHLFQYVKAAGIISAFTILNGEFAASMAATQNQTAQNLIAANQNVVTQLGSNIIERTLNIQPTVTVKSGTKINIMLNKNIQLPPIEVPPVSTVYKR